MSIRLGIALGATIMLAFGAGGCAAGSEAEPQDMPDEEIFDEASELPSLEELNQGGCSMSEIRGWQSVCRDACGGRSRGIHYCYSGMSMRHAGGACAC